MISGGDADTRAQINPGLVNALKRAHADLIALQASPFTRPKAMIEAVAPATQHDRQVCRMAFMTPNIQAQILIGRHPRGLALRQVLKAPMPLARADQEAWLEAISRR